MAFKNHLSLVGYIAAHAALSAKYKDLNGNVKELLPAGSGNALDLDQFRKDLFPSSTDGHPGVGVDVYPGSYAKGEITGRYLINDTKTDPTKVTNLIFNRDVGSKLNMVGDGLEFHGYLLKTTVTNGVKGATVKVPIYYDPKNVAKPGYYVTTTPYPMHVKGTSFTVDNTIQIPLDGVGEGNIGKNHSAPSIRYTFKANKSMDVKTVQGYDNDGAASGVNGVTYDYVNEVVSTYSTQAAVQQLPSTVNLFTGSTIDSANLVGPSDFFENTLNGLEITLGDYIYDETKRSRYSITSLGIRKSFRLSKEQLIIGNKVSVPFDYVPLADANSTSGLKPMVDGEKVNEIPQQILDNYQSWKDDASMDYYPTGETSYMLIDKSILKNGISRQASWFFLGQFKKNTSFYAEIIKVTTF